MASRPIRSKAFISLRVPADMADALEQLVQQSRADGIPASRSSVVRTLIRRALDEDPTGAETLEVQGNIWKTTQRAMGQVLELVSEQLPGLIEASYQDVTNTGEGPK